MVLKRISEHKLFRPAMGAALTVLCGLVLWGTPLGEKWVNASYDSLFRFSARSVTNKVALVLMDDYSFDQLHQARGQWDRALHTGLLNKLADDGCQLVVFDVLFDTLRNPETDKALAAAMARQRGIVLMAGQASATHPGLRSIRPELAEALFLEAARTNWGIAWFDWDSDKLVRKHWPFPCSETNYPSLSWAAAGKAGASLSNLPQQRWLRYYGTNGMVTPLSFDFALNKPTNYFADKIVFVGQKLYSARPDPEKDTFGTPYGIVSGVELHATSFLNLMNGDWLRRPDTRLEALLVLIFGSLLGGALGQLRPFLACGLAGAAGLAVLAGGVSLSYFTNYWFPWLVLAGGQVPCGLAWALASRRIPRKADEPADGPARNIPVPIKVRTAAPVSTGASPPNFSGWDTVLAAAQGHDDLPDAPDYEVFGPPFGEGGFGKVWLARNAIGQWQALKAVYQSKFGKKTAPYETEFKGIKRYKPISDKHPGLLRVDFVSKKKAEGYFYYVMELGDAQQTGWEEDPSKYKPLDLAGARAQAQEGRLPVRDCAQIALVLAEALEFLHSQGLTHRDVKPSNIIFVNGRPKLSDVGLVTDLRPPEEVTTYAGSPGYMPPPPEPPGTAQADIYGLGMVLYVISTGRDPEHFSSLSTSLLQRKDHAEFLKLSKIILKACQPDCALRYKSATDLRGDLLQVTRSLEQGSPDISQPA